MEAAPRIVLTADGSHSVYNHELEKHYHSIFGAAQESEWVYIRLGLIAALERFAGELRIFEVGFGTGLNALLTAQVALEQQRKISYTTVEPYPLHPDEARQLNYDQLLNTDFLALMHNAPWEQPIEIHPYFTLTKRGATMQDVQLSGQFHLIYFDAFASTAQPELWTTDVFSKLAAHLVSGGLLTTYCSKSIVQHALRAAGFAVEKHPGPFRKREILRAVRE